MSNGVASREKEEQKSILWIMFRDRRNPDLEGGDNYEVCGEIRGMRNGGGRNW